MYREVLDIKFTPKKYFDYSYEDNNEYRILTTNGLIKVSKLYYTLWNLIDGKNTYEDIIKKMKEINMKENANCSIEEYKTILENLNSFIYYLIENRVIISDWTSFINT